MMSDFPQGLAAWSIHTPSLAGIGIAKFSEPNRIRRGAEAMDRSPTTRRVVRPAWAAAVAVATCVVALPGLDTDGPSNTDKWIVPLPSSAAHTYRIDGKVRALVLWLGRDDVGRARLGGLGGLGDARRASLTLLAGSNPERAPRHLNQWVYLYEEVNGGVATTFLARSLTDAESMTSPDADLPAAALIGVSCTSVGPHSARVASAKVATDSSLTFRNFERVFDRITAPPWTITRTTVGTDVQPGFLIALAKALSEFASTPARATNRGAASITYLYNGTVYDMTLTRRAGPATDARLVRTGCEWADSRIVNRTTKTVTRFSVLYAPDELGFPIPLRMVYQPNWWLRLELELDDRPDPLALAADAAVVPQTRRVCASASPNQTE